VRRLRPRRRHRLPGLRGGRQISHHQAPDGPGTVLRLYGVPQPGEQRAAHVPRPDGRLLIMRRQQEERMSSGSVTMGPQAALWPRRARELALEPGLLRSPLFRAVRQGALVAGLAGAVGCSYGVQTETITDEEMRDYSGIAMP